MQMLLGEKNSILNETELNFDHLYYSKSHFNRVCVLQEYMAYDHQILERFLGFKPRLEQVQRMLLGNAVFSKNRYLLNDENTLLAREGFAKNIIQLNSQYRTFQLGNSKRYGEMRGYPRPILDMK